MSTQEVGLLLPWFQMMSVPAMARDWVLEPAQVQVQVQVQGMVQASTMVEPARVPGVLVWDRSGRIQNPIPLLKRR